MRLQRIIAMLPVRSMPASVEFYGRLGFRVEQRNDAWRWAMLDLDGCRLMVDESIDAGPHTLRSTVLYLYPDDVVAFHAQARGRGLSLPELETTFYGMSECRLEDPDGNRLWIGQEQAQKAPA